MAKKIKENDSCLLYFTYDDTKCYLNIYNAQIHLFIYDLSK